MYITILSLFFVRFLLYVVYVFALCSPYLEDNKVSIYLSIYLSNVLLFFSFSAGCTTWHGQHPDHVLWFLFSGECLQAGVYEVYGMLCLL